jgi:hypothetical protein
MKWHVQDLEAPLQRIRKSDDVLTSFVPTLPSTYHIDIHCFVVIHVHSVLRIALEQHISAEVC